MTSVENEARCARDHSFKVHCDRPLWRRTDRHDWCVLYSYLRCLHHLHHPPSRGLRIIPNHSLQTGSHNLGPKASSKNDDNLVIVRGSSALAQAYTVNIQSVCFPCVLFSSPRPLNCHPLIALTFGL